MIDTDRQLPICIVCNAGTTKGFSRSLDGVTVDYSWCRFCGHLTAAEIAAPVSYESEDYFKNVDTGWKERNAMILRLVRFLLRSSQFTLSTQSTLVDYGCGFGTLVSALNLAGLNAWGFEPYSPSFADGRVLKSWKEMTQTIASIDLLMCIEVLEHLRDPDRFLGDVSQLIRADGYILISTGMFRKGFHGADWYYLNPAAGHVSIFTEKSLQALLKRHEFEPVLRASELAWLFRKTATRQRSLTEKILLSISQSRVKTKLTIVELTRKVLGADWQPPKTLHRLWAKL